MAATASVNRKPAGFALRPRITHGMRSSAEYAAWGSMKSRCSNPNHQQWDRYGGRGITVCVAWVSFAAFYRDVGPRPSARHSLDRINNDGNYEPGNVRWTTADVQRRNQRRKTMCPQGHPYDVAN